jgi:hypothetical protein
MMLKLLSFESARMQKCMVGSLQHDMTANFDRMYPEMTLIYATKYAVSDGVMRLVSRTIGKLRQNFHGYLGGVLWSGKRIPETGGFGSGEN